MCFREYRPWILLQRIGTQKLRLIGLPKDADLYKLWNDKDMVDNMSLWPEVYTKQQLVQWKSMDAYDH